MLTSLRNLAIIWKVMTKKDILSMSVNCVFSTLIQNWKGTWFHPENTYFKCQENTYVHLLFRTFNECLENTNLKFIFSMSFCLLGVASVQRSWWLKIIAWSRKKQVWRKHSSQTLPRYRVTKLYVVQLSNNHKLRLGSMLCAESKKSKPVILIVAW